MSDLPGTEFDFLIGDWNVHHRYLVKRLTGSTDWQEFGGSAVARPLLGGLGNVDDNVIDFPNAPYKAISVRSFDPATQTWAIWWLDGRTPHDLDVPVIGQFEDGIGLFTADDTFDAKPIRMRFTWTETETDTPRWEQAFSSDDGSTWETNWVMNFKRKQTIQK